MLTRQSYINGETSHDAYYSQFVTTSLMMEVVACIGADRIRKSVDPHMNDIPLGTWDAVAMNVVRYRVPRSKWEAAGDFPSLGGRVCVAKAAARLWLQEQPKE